jgi:hypothetical protein
MSFAQILYLEMLKYFIRDDIQLSLVRADELDVVNIYRQVDHLLMMNSQIFVSLTSYEAQLLEQFDQRIISQSGGLLELV